MTIFMLFLLFRSIQNNMKKLIILMVLFLITSIPFYSYAQNNSNKKEKIKMTKKSDTHKPKVVKTSEEWRKQLSPLEFKILREKGTERPFTGIYDKFYESGTYYCAGCDQKLFESDTKFNSGCGWPSFYKPSDAENVIELQDTSHGMVRTEIQCANCNGHLGHVFNDGPKPTGLRYCINSAALKFVPKKNKEN